MTHYRRVRPSDAAQLATIQGYHIEHSNACFYYEALPESALAEKISLLAPVHPFIVCEQDGEVVGFAYASPMHPQDAYSWSVELTVYIDPGCLHQGLGSGLYSRLLALLRYQGYCHAYACITADNAPSIAMHERFGFRQVGYYPAVGYKGGRWLDVAWLHLPLVEHLPQHPQRPAAFADLPDDVLNAMLNA